MTIGELAERLEGSLDGSPDGFVRGVAEPAAAAEGDVVFCLSRAHRDSVVASDATCFVADEQTDLGRSRPVIRVKNPRLALARSLALLHPRTTPTPGVQSGARIDPSARVGSGVTVMDGAWIGPDVRVGDGTLIYPGAVVLAGVSMGRDCILYPGVTLCEGTVLGDRVIIHPGVVLGADGFGYVENGGRLDKIPQVGTVEIGDDVEIGANTTIDRATMGRTVVGAGTKIDNLVQIGHNVTIGRSCVIVAQTGIAGSVEIEDGVILGGQVGVGDHVRIGAGAKVASQSGIAKDIPPREVWSGSPAIPHRRWLRASRLFADLPDIVARLARVEKNVSRAAGGNEEEVER